MGGHPEAFPTPSPALDRHLGAKPHRAPPSSPRPTPCRMSEPAVRPPAEEEAVFPPSAAGDEALQGQPPAKPSTSPPPEEGTAGPAGMGGPATPTAAAATRPAPAGAGTGAKPDVGGAPAPAPAGRPWPPSPVYSTIAAACLAMAALCLAAPWLVRPAALRGPWQALNTAMGSPLS